MSSKAYSKTEQKNENQIKNNILVRSMKNNFRNACVYTHYADYFSIELLAFVFRIQSRNCVDWTKIDFK